MDPISLVGTVLTILLKYGPDAYVKARQLLAKKDLPTEAEWAELDAILMKSGEDYFKPRV